MNSQQPEMVKSMFSQVAKGYDQANTFMSLGIHKLWRKSLVRWSGVQPGNNVLDCATGTGDLAIEFKKNVGDLGQVLGTDFCKEMLDLAAPKAKALDLDIHFEVADAMNLPYEDERFEIVSISFGIRNVQDPVVVMREMARVLRPQGRLMILEFGQVEVPILAELYKFYSTKVLPRIGGFVTGKTDAYEYLQKSSALFPCGEKFLELMRQSQSFSHVEAKSLMGGLVYMYKGTKPPFAKK